MSERTWNLSPEEYAATKERVDKINAKAEKKGFTGRLELTYEVTTREYENAIGDKVKVVIYETTISGDAPSYNGWRFLASLDFTESGVIVNTAPGVEKVDRSLIEQGKCDHCKINRERRKAFLVSDGTRQLQVGSTCLKDFLGWEGKPVFISADSVAEEIDGFLGGGSWPATYFTDDVLAAAWAAIKVDGYVRAGDWQRTPTKSTVMDILNPPRNFKRAQEIRERYGSKVDENRDVAAKTRAFILSDEFTGTNEYVENMKVALAGETVSPKHFGLVVSAPQSWARHQERTLIKEREKTNYVDEFLGEIKERLRGLRVQVKAIRYIETDFGVSTLYTMVTDSGHLVKWFASHSNLGEDVTEDWHTLDGTVKKHEVWNGQKSTVLTRCSIKGN